MADWLCFVTVTIGESIVLTQNPRFLRGVVLTDFPTVTPGLCSENADVFELLDEIEQHVVRKIIKLSDLSTLPIESHVQFCTARSVLHVTFSSASCTVPPAASGNCYFDRTSFFPLVFQASTAIIPLHWIS